MCRMSALAATALALVLAAGQPAQAWPGRAKAKASEPAPAPAAAASTSGATASAAAVPRAPATAEQRAVVQRLDPLARAAFWAREAEIAPGDVAAGVGLSQALRAMGKHQEAATAAERVLSVNPDAVDALLELARARIGAAQGFYAIDPARRAQALAPRDWRPVSLLAVAYEQAERPDEALAAHRQAVALAPDNPAALCNLAMFLAGHGDPAEAERLLRTAAARPNAPIQVRQNLALVLGLQGRLDEAEALARKDLPPSMVANNMAYLRAAATPGNERSWQSMREAP